MRDAVKGDCKRFSAAAGVLVAAVVLLLMLHTGGAPEQKETHPAPLVRRAEPKGDNPREGISQSPESARRNGLYRRLTRHVRSVRGPALESSAAVRTAAEPPRPSVRVRVIDAASAEPLSNTSLLLQLDAPSGDLARKVRTDAEGFFEVQGLSPGLYAARLRHASFLAHSSVLEVLETPVAVEVALERGESLRGRIVDSAQNPIAGARVHLSRRDSDGPERASSLSTDNGSFEMHGLSGGEWTLIVAHKNYSPLEPRDLQLPEPPLHLVLEPRRVLRFRAVTADGAPASGARVSARVAGALPGMLGLRQARAGEDGVVALEGLPTSPSVTVLISGRHPEYAAASLTASVDELERGDVALVFQKDAEIGGCVVDETATPVPDARVELRGPVQRTILSTTAGEFRFTKLQPGRYTITATTDSLGASREVEVEVRPGERLAREVALASGPGRVAGRIVDTESIPLSLAKLRLERNGSYRETVSDIEGKFRFSGLQAGEYTLHASHRRLGALLETTVEAGNEGLLLRLEPSGSIGGFVRVSGSAKGYTLQLTAKTAKAKTRLHRFTSPSLYFRLVQVPPGTYDLTLLRAGQPRAVLPGIQVRPGEETGPVVLKPGGS